MSAVATRARGAGPGIAPGAPVIDLAGLRKAYAVGSDVEVEVLHGIDFRLERGEFAALIGPSGSGKSTLLNAIGLLERPTAGDYRLLGHDTTTLPEDELTELRCRSIGFVFQFHHLLPAFSARENVLLPHLLAEGRVSDSARTEVAALLTAVGLADRMDYRPQRLSGGQQQRVAIARALSLSPPLVLADEPTGNLDTRTSDDIFALLRRFNRERGIAFLIVTHDSRLARRCDRIVELVDGVIATDRANAAVERGE
jgi:lipoprotein-releasing system ATP-binding protein